MKQKWPYATRVTSLAAAVLVIVLLNAHRHRDRVVGFWRVTSEFPSTDHTYEFRANNICVEKYRSEQIGGSPEEPLGPVLMDAVITYRYISIGGGKYRLFRIASTMDGAPTHWGATWTVLGIAIEGDTASVREITHQVTSIEKIAKAAITDVMNASAADQTASPSKTNITPQETQTWERDSWRRRAARFRDTLLLAI